MLRNDADERQSSRKTRQRTDLQAASPLVRDTSRAHGPLERINRNIHVEYGEHQGSGGEFGEHAGRPPYALLVFLF